MRERMREMKVKYRGAGTTVSRETLIIADGSRSKLGFDLS